MKLQHLMIILASFAVTSFTTPSYGAKDKDVQPTPNVIRNSAPAEPGQWICFRKTIRLRNKPTKNELRIATDSKYWLWVNGKLEVFEGQLKRGPNRQDTYIDVLSLKNLKRGENNIAVLVWYFGKSGFSHETTKCPGLYFDLKVGKQRFVSDDTWKTLVHPSFYIPEGTEPNYRLSENNIGYDARKDPGNFFESRFNDTAWENAVVEEPGKTGWGAFHDRNIPMWRDYGVKAYESEKRDGDKIICSLPYNAQVTPLLTVKAPAGKVIGIQTDDYVVGNNTPSVRAEYITSEGLQTYESLGWMNGHEVIYTIPQGVEVVKLSYRETGYDCDFSGSFTCDNEAMNSLWKKSQRTLYITMRDNYMDCPDRERACWIGDFSNELVEIFYALSPEANQLSAKCFLEFAAWQDPDGVLHGPVPGNYKPELPMQSMAAAYLGGWNYYLGSGDIQTIKEVFPAWKKYIHMWQMRPDDLVTYRRGGWDWGDWGTEQDMQAMCQLWYSISLEYYARQAEVIGENAEAAWARELNSKMKTALRKVLKDGDTYRWPEYTGMTDDRVQALAVLAGIATEEEYPALASFLAKNWHASPYMERYILEALCKMGYIDLAVKRMNDRYSYMVNSRYTTLWEFFRKNDPGNGSYNHAWSGGPLIIMSEFVAGVRPLEPGFSSFMVRPHLGTLTYAKASVPSVKGDIQVQVRKTGEGETELEVTVPQGTSAVLSLPDGAGSYSLDEKGVDPFRDGKFRNITVGPGTHIYISK